LAGKAGKRQTISSTQIFGSPGSKGWMVYDRQRKAPAMVGTTPAVNLTKEQANKIEHKLTAEVKAGHSK
jgi:hypothetical protein